MLNNRQILPNRNCSTLAIPWGFYKISRAFDGFSTSIIWQKDHPSQLKHRPIFRLVRKGILQAAKEEFGRMEFQKKSSLGDRTKCRSTSRQVLMEAPERVTPRVY